MNQQNPLEQFLGLLIPHPQFGAILPTADTLALFNLTNDYHVKKHRDTGSLQEGLHYIQVKGGIAPGGTQIQDNVVRIYYTFEGLITLAKLNIGDRASLVYQTLMSYKPTEPNGAIVQAPPSQMQPWQAAPTQLTSPHQYASQSYSVTGVPEQFAITPAAIGGGSLTYAGHPKSITSPPTLGNSPAHHPMHVITTGVEQAIENILSRHGGGSSTGNPDANAHDMANYLMQQQRLTTEVVQAVASAVAGANPKTEVVTIQGREIPQWAIWFLGIGLTVFAASVVFLISKAALQPSSSSLPPQSTEVVG